MDVLPHIEQILDIARSAPSRGNLQPWRFVVDGAAISFVVDEARDPSPMNAGQRMARIGVGAAVESALIGAARIGAAARFETPRANALVTLAVGAPTRAMDPDKALLRRATNRRVYDGRAVDDATLVALRGATPAMDGVKTHGFGRERVRLLGPLVETGETLLLESPGAREATVSDTRFDARDRDEVTTGLSLGSLELSARERATLDELRRAPRHGETVGAYKQIAKSARKLVESASGVCMITAPNAEPMADVNVGRCMQRAWIALTRRDMVGHPLSAIPAIEAMLEFDESARIAVGAEESAAVVAACRLAFPSVEHGSRIALLMRFGWAAAPTTRSGRRPLRESLESA